MSFRQLVVKDQLFKEREVRARNTVDPSISVGSAFLDSTNYRLKILKKTFSRTFQKAKLNFVLLAAITWHLHCIYKYLHSIYMVLGIISSLEMS